MLLRPFATLARVSTPFPNNIHTIETPGQNPAISTNGQHSFRSSFAESDGPPHSIAYNVMVDPHQMPYSPKRHSPRCPEPSSATIILTFALNEVFPLAIPPHLPESRAIAIVTHRSGPTMEDLRAVASCRTPLFADIPCGPKAKQLSSADILDPDHKFEYDTEFCRSLRLSYDLARSSKYPYYIPGTFTGTWEGSYMVC